MGKSYSLAGMGTRMSIRGHRLWITPIFVAMAACALLMGLLLGRDGSSLMAAVAIGLCTLTVVLILRQDEFMAVSVIALHLYADWYLGMGVIAPLLTGLLLGFYFLARSPEHPWGKPRALWLWGILLVLALFPAFRGSLTRYDTAYYYPNLIFGALLMFWLGVIVAKDIKAWRRFLTILVVFSTLLAIITIVQERTGILAFGTSRFDVFLASTANFTIVQGSDVYRLGSFFVNPDWNGACLALLLCLPLGLMADSTTVFAKLFYLGATLIIIPALLFTYSVGSWLSAGVGLLVFTLLVGRLRYRVWMAFLLVAVTSILFCFFPAQIALLLQHGADPTVLKLRTGSWHTALRVIEAFPWTGVGMGLQAYLLRAEPYRVPEQYKPLAHPHNSYLELAAMAGLPVLLLFLGLIFVALCLALKNWARVPARQRALFGGGIAAVVALSANSFSVNVWTLPPLSALGWLLLGCMASPLLTQSLATQTEGE